MSMYQQLVQESSYELIAPAEAFTQAISALSKRTMDDGPAGVLRYSFFVNEEAGTAGALIVYADPDAWIKQHEFVPTLEEYKQFYTTIRLVGLRLFGNLPQEIRQGLDERNIAYEYVGQLAAGFSR